MTTLAPARTIKVSDYVADTVARHGIRHVFMVTGGGAMHLNDAFGRHPDLEYVACHHEQACAMAAESYFRLSNRLACVNVTTGPGGTNAITGVMGAWHDSIGMLVVSGQVKYETTVRSTGLPLRQLGDQEVDIVKMVGSITKYAEMVVDPESIRYHLEKAIHLARNGRPGPTWLDIPMNVQGARIDPTRLRGYDPAEDAPVFETADLEAAAAEILRRLREARRPVVMAGTGVRLSGAHPEFIALIDRLGIPVVTAWNAHDALWDDHPCYVGRPGTVGDRAGNFAVQNADFLLVLGCRLNIRQISYNWRTFARAAFKVVVDIDAAELKKPTIAPDLPVHADLARFLPLLNRLSYPGPTAAHREYLDWCLARRRRYPTVLPEYREVRGAVNPYVFAEALFKRLEPGDIVVTGDGTACVVTFQAAILKAGQRLYTNSGTAAMGYDLPAAIGAAVAARGQRIVCLAGDGSIQMNLAELQTILGYRLPVKLFVLNNNGYHSIRQTQRNYFPDNIVGCGPESGVTFPSFEKLAMAYGYPFVRCSDHAGLDAAIAATLAGDEAKMCELVLDLEQSFAPKLSSRQLPDGRMVSSPLEDLFPFLPPEELRENMLIPMLEE